MNLAPSLPPTWPESTIERFTVNAVVFAMVVLVWPERPWLANADNNMHYRVRAQNRAHWRDIFRDLSEGSPRLQWCDLEVVHETPTRRSTDYAACAPTAKAAMDGCRDFTDDDRRSPTFGERFARILPDDSPKYVASCKFWAPIYTGRDAMTLALTGPLAEQDHR